MRIFLNLPHRWLLVLALLAVAFLACDSDDAEDPGGGNEPTELPELADLVGRWGIEQTVSGGNSQNSVPCENTLEVFSSGNFTFIDVARGEWIEGNMAFDQTDSSLTLTFDNQTVELKLLSIADGAFTLQSEDNDGGTVTLSTQIFTALEDGDCPGIELGQIVNKWSINSFGVTNYELQGEGDELGTMAGGDEITNIPVNRFTTEFVGDGSYLTINLVNEFNYNTGNFRRLDDQNLVLTFEDNDGEEVEMLVHLKALAGSTATFQTVRYSDDDGDGENEQGELRIVSEFTMTINDETVPTITAADMIGKWSVSAVVESELEFGGQVLNEDIRDNLPNNKMTLGFRDEGELLFIDLLSGPQIRLGEWEMLDGSNFLISIGNDEDDEGDGDDGDDDDEEDDYEIFQLMENNDGQIVLASYERPEGDEDYDVFSFELTLNRNDGSEPSVNSEEILGDWVIIETENLQEDNGGDMGDDEGPQVGMEIRFNEGLDGAINFQGQQVFAFEYEQLDLSNILVTFEEEDDGGNVEESYNLFHVNARPGGNMELMIYIIRGPNDDDGGDDGGGDDEDDANMELEFRVVLEKNDG